MIHLIAKQFTAPLLLHLLLLPLQEFWGATAQLYQVHGGTVDLETCENQESNFKIELKYMGIGRLDDRYTEAFEAAAQRWSKVIVGNLPDVRPFGVQDWFGDTFARQYAEPVDDIVIGYDIPDTIDGLGGTLGAAGPIYVRRDRLGRTTSTISGVMTFDGEDLKEMPDDDVKAVILHEMGHVLGLVGTTNGKCTMACDEERPLRQANYLCRRAAQEYEEISIGQELELENNGGMGTACGHWEEDVFRTLTSSELMTGFFEDNLFQPLSSVTVAALEDIGYEVDYCGADVWPSTENTIKRFQIYKTVKAMQMLALMSRLKPRWEVDEETGERTDWVLKSDEDQDPGETPLRESTMEFVSQQFDPNYQPPDSSGKSFMMLGIGWRLFNAFVGVAAAVMSM